MRNATLLLLTAIVLFGCGTPTQNNQPTTNDPTQTTQVFKDKKLWVIYDNHYENHEASFIGSKQLITRNPGTYGVYVEGIVNDAKTGQKLIIGSSEVIMVNEDPRYRYQDKEFLAYMFDTVSNASLQKDIQEVINWVETYYPSQPFAQDKPFNRLPNFRSMKDSFDRSFKKRVVLERVRRAEMLNVAFENSAIKAIESFPNAHVIVGTAHMRITHMLCEKRGFALQSTSYNMTAEGFSSSLQLSIAKFLILPDSVYENIDTIFVAKFRK